VLSLEYMRRPATRALLATILSDGSDGSKGPPTYKFRDQDVRITLKREFFIDNLLGRVHYRIVMIM